MAIVYVMCTNVGRAILKAHLTYHNEIPIEKIYCLSAEKGLSKSNYDSYFDLKEQHKLPVSYVNSINADDVLQEIERASPEVLIQSGWSQKFNSKLLALPKYGCIGEHPSPIPKGRGAATVNWALINGETDWADSFFIMTDEYDAGPVVSQRRFEIRKRENVKDAYDKVALSAFFAIKENLDKWHRGEFEYPDISCNQPSYFTRRRPQDGELNADMSADLQLNYVRALTSPYPGAFFRLNGENIIIWAADFVEKTTAPVDLKPISDHLSLSAEGVYLLGACENYVKPTVLENERFPPMDAQTFVSLI